MKFMIANVIHSMNPQALKQIAIVTGMKLPTSVTISYRFNPIQQPKTMINQKDHKTWKQNGNIVRCLESTSCHASSLRGLSSDFSISINLSSWNALIQEAPIFINPKANKITRNKKHKTNMYAEISHLKTHSNNKFQALFTIDHSGS